MPVEDFFAYSVNFRVEMNQRKKGFTFEKSSLSTGWVKFMRPGGLLDFQFFFDISTINSKGRSLSFFCWSVNPSIKKENTQV